MGSLSYIEIILVFACSIGLFLGLSFIIIAIVMLFTQTKIEGRWQSFILKVNEVDNFVHLILLFMVRWTKKGLQGFLGKEVGLKGSYQLKSPKIIGPYIEHLFLYYWSIGTVLVIAFRPIDPIQTQQEPIWLVLAYIGLLSSNVITDAVSLFWTNKCFGDILENLENNTANNHTFIFFVNLIKDLFVATLCFFCAQVISNALYAVQIGHEEQFLEYAFDIETALLPYSMASQTYNDFLIPGQLLFTLTTYIPTFAFYGVFIILIIGRGFYRAFNGVHRQLSIVIERSGSPIIVLATGMALFIASLSNINSLMSNYNLNDSLINGIDDIAFYQSLAIKFF